MPREPTRKSVTFSQSEFTILIAGLFILTTAAADQPQNAPSTDAHLLDPNTVVVLPIVNDTTSPEFTQLSEELSELILQQLNSSGTLNVIGGASVMPYAGSTMTEQEIGKIFGAENIVVVDVVEDEESLQISMTVFSGSSGTEKFGGAGSFTKSARSLDFTSGFSRMAERVIESLTRPKFTPPTQKQIALDNQAQFLDVTLREKDRISALAGLHYAFDDLRSGAVAAAAVELAANSDNERTRGQVWRYLQGTKDPYLVQPLLDALAYDSSQYVRREAATTLEDYIEEPGVRDALATAMENDDSKNVRDQALLSMSTEQEQQEIITRTILDESLSDRERLYPLWSEKFQNSNRTALTDEAIDAMVVMAMNSDNPDIRTAVWRHLRGVNRSEIVSPLLKHLADDPSEDVRISAAVRLGEYLDQAGVRDALETAATDDAVPNVRRAARVAINRNN